MNYRPLHEIRHQAADEIAAARRRAAGYPVGAESLAWLAVVTRDVCTDIDEGRWRGAVAAALRVGDTLLLDWQELGLTQGEAHARALYWRQAAAAIEHERTA